MRRTVSVCRPGNPCSPRIFRDFRPNSPGSASSSGGRLARFSHSWWVEREFPTSLYREGTGNRMPTSKRRDHRQPTGPRKLHAHRGCAACVLGISRPDSHEIASCNSPAGTVRSVSGAHECASFLLRLGWPLPRRSDNDPSPSIAVKSRCWSDYQGTSRESGMCAPFSLRPGPRAPGRVGCARS